MNNDKYQLPDDLQRCVDFHGHICPGLIYGYRVAKEALRLMNLQRSADEEIVAICENDSCAVDALQILLGTCAGKGNLILRDYGKNAYTIVSRDRCKAYRFSRNVRYVYAGADEETFNRLDAAVAAKTASDEERQAHRQMKITDLLARPFPDIFMTTEVSYEEPAYAPLQPSEPCACCGEMTMVTKMSLMPDGRRVCLPCLRQQ